MAYKKIDACIVQSHSWRSFHCTSSSQVPVRVLLGQFSHCVRLGSNLYVCSLPCPGREQARTEPRQGEGRRTDECSFANKLLDVICLGFCRLQLGGNNENCSKCCAMQLDGALSKFLGMAFSSEDFIASSLFSAK